METCKASCMISILNDDDNPTFAVRPTPRYSKHAPTTFYTQPDQSPSQPVAKRGYGSWRDTTTVSPESPGHICYDSTSTDDATLAREFATMQAVPELLTLKTNKKHKYSCPFAASHACQATFTTSGHAARHGKKHTGEKRVHCPTCNKAFARKDNMRQHRRTHRTFDTGELMPEAEDDDTIRTWKTHRNQPSSQPHSAGDEFSRTSGLGPPTEDGSNEPSVWSCTGQARSNLLTANHQTNVIPCELLQAAFQT
ncbi:hypothetical protein FQN54_008154 [Arachnomyces sp. PD_36]|nr:hypothetical protein FQN54_008154 [Arachnomyces sp. PD_36]